MDADRARDVVMNFLIGFFFFFLAHFFFSNFFFFFYSW